MERMILLESGRWYARIDVDARRREHLVLIDPTHPTDCMRARLPFSWRQRGDETLEELARNPAPIGDRPLGELSADELRELRDRLTDFGGSRRQFRPPTSLPEA